MLGRDHRLQHRSLRQQVQGHTGEPDALAGQVGPDRVGTAAGGVAGGEGEVGDGGHHADPLGQLRRVRDGQRHPGDHELALGAGQPSRHRRRAGQEQPGDVRRADPEDETQAQRAGALGRQGRVGAQQQQPEPLVGEQPARVGEHRVGALLHLGVHDQQPVPAHGDRLCSEPVDDPPPGCGQQPRRRVDRDAVRGPAAGGRLEGVCEGVLGQVETAVLRDEQGQHPAPLLTPDLLDGRCAHAAVTSGRRPASPRRCSCPRPAASRSRTRAGAGRTGPSACRGRVPRPGRTRPAARWSPNGPSVTSRLPSVSWRSVVAFTMLVRASPPYTSARARAASSKALCAAW